MGQIREFQKLFLAPGFLSYASVSIVGALSIIFYFGPKYVSFSSKHFVRIPAGACTGLVTPDDDMLNQDAPHA